MKNYVKPTFILAAAASGQPSSCFIDEDLELIAGILGEGYDKDAIFGADEACAIGIPSEYYCKYTSVELGKAQGFLS